jgi:hypothetical protein
VQSHREKKLLRAYRSEKKGCSVHDLPENWLPRVIRRAEIS